jgi:roadblock/LC7 domain-containing protein
VSEFDDLVKLDGVVMAGRFGPDGRIAEHKSEALFVENPQLLEMAAWFCAAATMMFKSMAFGVDTVMRSGFDQTSWLPQKGWSFWGGDYAIAVHGDRFVFAEMGKMGSLDKLFHLMVQGNP